MDVYEPKVQPKTAAETLIEVQKNRIGDQTAT